jgi:hypothetical protein
MKQTFCLVHATARSLALRAVQEAPDGMTVAIAPETRSQEQNRLLWPLLTLWAKHQDICVNGEKVKIAKEGWKVVLLAAFKKRHGIPAQFALGLDGELIPLGYETHTMPKRLFADFLTFVLAESLERQMELPPRVADECQDYIRRAA